MLADLNLTIIKIFTILQSEDSYCRGRIDLCNILPGEGLHKRACCGLTHLTRLDPRRTGTMTHLT